MFSARSFVFIFCILFFQMTMSANAADYSRVALLIGIQNYQHLSSLENPKKDTLSLADALRTHGFDVSVHVDLNEAQIRQAIQAFSEKAKSAREAIVFYAGHGMAALYEDQFVNVIAPSDGRFKCGAREAFRAVPMSALFDAVRDVPNKVFVFDACRNDPFTECPDDKNKGNYGFSQQPIARLIQPAQETAQTQGSARNSDAGASAVQADKSSALIVFSTDLGTVAQDGDPGDHSPFMKHLLTRIQENPRSSIRYLFDDVSTRVASEPAICRSPG